MSSERRLLRLWSHPIQGNVLNLDVPAGAGDANLWLQFADDALRDKPHPAVDVSLWVDGALVCSIQIHDSDHRQGSTAMAP